MVWLLLTIGTRRYRVNMARVDYYGARPDGVQGTSLFCPGENNTLHVEESVGEIDAMLGVVPRRTLADGL